MTNEAVKIELTNNTGFPRRFTCSSAAAITKGTLLKFADPRTASASTGTGDFFAGIASMDKSATNDTSTSISVWTDGIFDLKASGAITAGSNVITAAPGNMVMLATAGDEEASGALIVGYALEDAADEETINVRVRV